MVGCLAKTHVVGQAAAETDPVEELQPAETTPLVGTQRRHEPGRLDPLRPVMHRGDRAADHRASRWRQRPAACRRRSQSARLTCNSRRQFGGQPQQLERRQLGVVASVFGEVGEGPAGLVAVESHPATVDVDQAGARCRGALEQGLVDRCVVDHHRPVDDRRGAEPAASRCVLRLGDTPGARRPAGEALRGQQLDVDRCQRVDRLERGRSGVELDAGAADRRARATATARASRCRPERWPGTRRASAGTAVRPARLSAVAASAATSAAVHHRLRSSGSTSSSESGQSPSGVVGQRQPQPRPHHRFALAAADGLFEDRGQIVERLVQLGIGAELA